MRSCSVCTQWPCLGCCPEATQEINSLSRTSGILAPRLLVHGSVEARDVVAQARMLAQGAEGVQSSFHSRTALWNVEQTWGDVGYRERRGAHGCFWVSPARLGPALCWGEFETPRWSSCGPLERPPSWDNKRQLRRFRVRN